MSAASKLILGIETGCDETAAAVVRSGTPGHGARVLSNTIASQNDLHAEYKGVVPEIASRAHAERILPVVRAALAQANATLPDLHAVAVGNRPGLIGSLLVGVAAAKSLAWSLGIPVIGVDHVRAHLYAGCLDVPLPSFPALGLVVSGGHTSLYHCPSLTEARRIGATIDDAVGEAYDKAATILGLPYPGGPNLDTLAQRGDPARATQKFPVSRLSPDSLDFSFSGLKTSVLYAVRGVPPHPARRAQPAPPPPQLNDQQKADLAAAFQKAAIGAVVLKLRRAVAAHPECRTLLVGGGVSANSLLRAELTQLGREEKLDVRLPKMAYCLDNAAMIAGLAHHLLDARDWTTDPLTMTADPTTAL